MFASTVSVLVPSFSRPEVAIILVWHAFQRAILTLLGRHQINATIAVFHNPIHVEFAITTSLPVQLCVHSLSTAQSSLFLYLTVPLAGLLSRKTILVNAFLWEIIISLFPMLLQRNFAHPQFPCQRRFLRQSRPHLLLPTLAFIVLQDTQTPTIRAQFHQQITLHLAINVWT